MENTRRAGSTLQLFIAMYPEPSTLPVQRQLEEGFLNGWQVDKRVNVGEWVGGQNVDVNCWRQMEGGDTN